MDKISVVVPVYNVSQYLKKALDSIINQTYKNLEIIIVNDGSTDNSLSICKEYAKLDKRIKIIDKENGGLSDARNSGTANSTGEFIIYIDSDDYIEKDMLYKLYNNIISTNSDVSVCGVNNIYKNTSSPQFNEIITFDCDCTEFIREYLIGEKIPGSICNKLIKTDIAKKILFPVGRIYEDIFYHLELIKHAKKYIITTEPLYNYFHRNDSITTRAYSRKNIDCIIGYTRFYKYIKLEQPSLKKEAFFRLSHAYFTVLDIMLLDNNYKSIPEYKFIISFLKKNFRYIFANDIFRFSRRIASLTLKININAYKFLLLKQIKYKKEIN